MEQHVIPLDLVIELVKAEIRLHLRLEIELPLKSPVIFGCCQTHGPSLILNFFGGVPEVRVLPSPGITRL